MRFVAETFGRVVVMGAGQVLLQGTPGEVFGEPAWPTLASTFLEPPLAARIGAGLGLGCDADRVGASRRDRGRTRISRSMTEPRIVVVGSTMIDLVAYADRLPDDGETVVGTSYQTGFGGKGANQAVMAARFGASVAMVNTLGDDGTATRTSSDFAAEGIDTSFMRRASGLVGCGADLGRRERDQPDHHRARREPRGARRGRGRGGRVVHADGRDRPVRDPPGDDERPALPPPAGSGRRRSSTRRRAPAVDAGLLAVTDWLVPNETEFALVTGQPLRGGPRMRRRRPSPRPRDARVLAGRHARRARRRGRSTRRAPTRVEHAPA